MSSRERRELALAALFSPIDPDQQSQCWDCKRASLRIVKNTVMKERKGEDGEKIEEVESEELLQNIHCEHYNALMLDFTYHCDQFRPLPFEEDE